MFRLAATTLFTFAAVCPPAPPPPEPPPVYAPDAPAPAYEDRPPIEEWPSAIVPEECP